MDQPSGSQEIEGPSCREGRHEGHPRGAEDRGSTSQDRNRLLIIRAYQSLLVELLGEALVPE